MRSKGDVDINAIAKEFGGGGHKNASGCSATGDLEDLKRLFQRSCSSRSSRESSGRSCSRAAGSCLPWTASSSSTSRRPDVARRRGRRRGALLGETRIGHTGTLDPLATGVLPLACGRATRLVRFLSASDKDYEATIRFGVTTDSYDVTGTEIEPIGRCADA